jgi:hypothetical protein
VEARQGYGAPAARKADAVDHVGDGADGRVVAPMAGDEQDALVVADVDGERDVHVREDDDVFQRDE